MIQRVPVFPYLAMIVHPHVRRGCVDSFRFVVCDRADCRQVFFLCRRCDRGDRYCSQRCAYRARHATLRAAGRRYQHSRRGRGQHAARQARYRGRRRAAREKVTHQTSHALVSCGMVAPPAALTVTRAAEQEEPVDADAAYARRRGRLRCARCGRPGRWARHTTLAHCRPRRMLRR